MRTTLNVRCLSPPAHEERSMAATHSGTLTKTPLGLGLTLDPDNIVAAVKEASQAEREGHFQVGDLVVSLNGEVPAHGKGVTAIIQSLPMGTQLEFSLQSAAAREATKSLEPAPQLAGAGRVRERQDVIKKAVIFVLTGASVRKFSNSQSSFKKSGMQKPHSVFVRVAQNKEWILTWQEKHGVVVSVSDDLFDAEFQGSRWGRAWP